MSPSHSSPLTRPLCCIGGGHLSGQGLQKLSRDKLVHGLDSTSSEDIDFCEACAHGKQKQTPFKSRGNK